MANSKIYLGNTNIGSLFIGASDISIYLGENKVYPLAPQTKKLIATYTGGVIREVVCDSGTTLSSGDTKPSGYEASAMTSAVIGDCVTTIGNNVFQNCSSLTSVTLSDNVTSITRKAFNGCTSLASIDIPSGVTDIGGATFQDCTGLTSITIPDSVTSIGQSAFTNCYSLSNCTIGSGVTSISNRTFYYCTGLTSIDIPDSVTTIGGYAFNNCTSLTSITVNSTTPQTLFYGAFNGSTCPIYVPCESVNAYKTATNWSDYASRITCPPFEGKFKATYSGGETYELDCDGNTTLTTGNTKPTGYEYSAMTEAIIGDCVTEIGYKAFSGCTNLSSVTIPDSVTSIGVSAFHDCSALTSVYVPDSVISIDDMSFRNCKKLTTVHLPSGLTIISESLFLTCTSLTSIDIPSGVTSIGNGAIRFCQSLTTIDIPSGVTSIGRGAFYECSGLTSVTVNAITPPTLGSEAFNGTTCQIYVPSASVNAYKTATNWSSYASRIQAIP